MLEYALGYAAGIPKEVRIIYLSHPRASRLIRITDIEKSVSYHAFYFDPRTGKEQQIGQVVPDKQGTWQPPPCPIIQDFVLVMEAKP
jgi:hypothetical protein